jgi:hypothetical protein
MRLSSSSGHAPVQLSGLKCPPPCARHREAAVLLLPVTPGPTSWCRLQPGYPDEQTTGRPLQKQEIIRSRTKWRVAKDLTHLLVPPCHPHRTSAVGPGAVPPQQDCRTAELTAPPFPARPLRFSRITARARNSQRGHRLQDVGCSHVSDQTVYEAAVQQSREPQSIRSVRIDVCR